MHERAPLQAVTPAVSAAGQPAVSLAAAQTTARLLLGNLGRVVVGKRFELELVVCALACGGHVLFEDVPGTAKTVLSRALAGSIGGASVSRIQCTPDLQPLDVTGSSVFDQRLREFVFRPGPVFANVVLLDEVNRATPKTQAALLEAMAEGQVTVDGVTRVLPVPFLLLATENPVEHEGTFLLPEAELDRFFLRTTLGYPDEAQELEIVLGQLERHPLDTLEPVVELADVAGLVEATRSVFVHRLLREWIVRLVRATRELDIVELGASVRGSIALEKAARARALVAGRDHVVADDVVELIAPVIGHRLILSPSFVARARTLGRDAAEAELVGRVLERAPRPTAAP